MDTAMRRITTVLLIAFLAAYVICMLVGAFFMLADWIGGR